MQEGRGQPIPGAKGTIQKYRHICRFCGKAWASSLDLLALDHEWPCCYGRGERDPEEGLLPEPKERIRIKGYRLTAAEHDRLIEEQAGVCAICGRAPLGARGLVIDHNHQTGEVRGLLCHDCNVGIGWLQDNPDLLLAAAAYLTLRGNYAGMKRPGFLGTPRQTEGAQCETPEPTT